MARDSSLELRGGVRSQPLPGHTVLDRQAARFLPDLRARDADPAAIRAKAIEEERDGFDSALVTVYSSWPDPWLVASWALAATERLRITVAHRPGVQQPTAAARSLATLDRLSGGRAAVHMVIGSSDADMRRDGDHLGKEERYARAADYLEVFTRTLEAREPFDHDGPFYRVRDAWSGFRPARRPPISLGGSSPAALELAARHADIYAGAFTTPARTEAILARLKELNPARSLRSWKHFTVILGESDADARAHAGHLRQHGEALLARRSPADLAGAAQTARDRERGDDEGALRAGVIRAYHESFDRLPVGSVETVAREIELFRRAGIDIVQIEATSEEGRDRHLRQQLLERLRGAA